MKKYLIIISLIFCVFQINAQNIDRAAISAGGLNDNMINATIGQIFDVSMTSDEISIDFGTFSDTTFVGGKILNPDTAIIVASVKQISSFDTESISCFPNPVKDVLNIDFPNNKENFTIFVSDIFGKQILSFSNVNSDNKVGLNVQNLPSGTYILNFKTKTNTNYSPVKFVKLNN